MNLFIGACTSGIVEHSSEYGANLQVPGIRTEAHPEVLPESKGALGNLPCGGGEFRPSVVVGISSF